MDLLLIVQIIGLLAGILISCEIFTNAIENLGERLNLGHEFTGSILAAIGTALPETILPLVAIYLAGQAGADAGAKEDIAIGAILGAPFMLSTLAMFLLGLSIFTHRKTRKSMNLVINLKHLERDIKFFLITFSIALLSTLVSTHYISKIIDYLCTQNWGIELISLLTLKSIPNECIDSSSIVLRSIFALIIVGSYILYLVETYKTSASESSGEDNACPLLYFERYLNFKTNMFMVVLQVLIGVGGIIYFAHGFIGGVEQVATIFAISPLVVSLIVCPIATELPEKVNSWIWSSQNKDTLAMGNVSGAMVFQAAIPCAIGIMLTPWHLNFLALSCALIAITSSLILFITIKIQKKVSYQTLLLCGSLYVLYLGIVFFRG